MPATLPTDTEIHSTLSSGKTLASNGSDVDVDHLCELLTGVSTSSPLPTSSQPMPKERVARSRRAPRQWGTETGAIETLASEEKQTPEQPGHRRTVSDTALLYPQQALQMAYQHQLMLQQGLIPYHGFEVSQVMGVGVPMQAYPMPMAMPWQGVQQPFQYQPAPLPRHRRSMSEDGASMGEVGNTKRCYNCDGVGHLSRCCPLPCSFCRQPGHWSGSCELFLQSVKKDKNGSSPPPGVAPVDSSQIKCFNCGNMGHRSIHCQEPCQYCFQVGHWSGVCPQRPDKK